MPWGERVAAFRERKSWTQAKLAAAVGVTLRAVQMWEANKRLPRLDVAVKLADALGIALDDLRTHDKPRSRVKTETLADRIKRKKVEQEAAEIFDVE